MAAAEIAAMDSAPPVGMLEVIVTTCLEAETKSAEAMGAPDSEGFMKDAEAEKEYKHKIEVKTKLDKDQEKFEVGRYKKMFVLSTRNWPRPTRRPR